MKCVLKLMPVLAVVLLAGTVQAQTVNWTYVEAGYGLGVHVGCELKGASTC